MARCGAGIRDGSITSSRQMDVSSRLSWISQSSCDRKAAVSPAAPMDSRSTTKAPVAWLAMWYLSTNPSTLTPRDMLRSTLMKSARAMLRASQL